MSDVWTVQTWKEETRIHDDMIVSLDAAEEIARAHTMLGYTVRVLAHGRDYCYVYTPDGAMRAGTYAQTTMVHGA